MKHFVITPYYKESRELLERCIDSVSQQNGDVSHILVADGFPQKWLENIRSIRHITLDKPTANWGNTPRLIGCNLAMAEDAFSISILDADNWYEPFHIETCENCLTKSEQSDHIDFIVSKRIFRRMDLTSMAIPEEPNHIDSNCYMYLRGAFDIIPYWGLVPKPYAHITDRFIYNILKNRKRQGLLTNTESVNYLAMYKVFYELLGEKVPEDAKDGFDSTQSNSWYSELSQREKQIVDRLCGNAIF